MKYKNIQNNGKTFLRRLSFNCRRGGSIKIHLITDDDIKPHTHPWDFTSLILFGGYREITAITEQVAKIKTYGWLSKNKKSMNEPHQVVLRRFLGIKIPALTIGRYGEKKQLCSLCQELGYCKTKKNIDEKIKAGI